MWNKGKRFHVLAVLLLLAAYIASIAHSLTERKRRSLQLQEEVKAGDQVHVSLRIVEANPNASEFTARLSFLLSGRIAKDAVTPAANLKLLLNSLRGPQQFDFPKDRRINPVFAVFSLTGNVNRYPFDVHDADIWILVTTPSSSPQAPPLPADDKLKQKEPAGVSSELVLGAAELQRSEQIPVSLNLSASITGLKFKGRILETQSGEIDHIELHIRRSDSVIVLSLLNMLLMLSLAMSVFFMALRVTTSDEKLDLSPLFLSITLIFGLPALRNAQPGIPPLGAFSDYVSFLWAEYVVAGSAIIIMSTWLVRSRHSKSEGSH